jgi:hypothetical protein
MIAGRAVFLAALPLVAGCGTPPARPPATAGAAPVSGLVATLEDETRTLPSRQIAWFTYWRLCWDPYPGAQGYEIQALTSEGASPRLRTLHERCFRLTVAAGRNDESRGFSGRDVLLGLQAGQLAYRVRARRDGNRVSPWSTPASVPEPTGDATRDRGGGVDGPSSAVSRLPEQAHESLARKPAGTVMVITQQTGSSTRHSPSHGAP